MTQEENIYKNFDLDNFVNEDKAKAIIDFLDIDGEYDNLTESDDYFTLNERIVKSGTSPEGFKKQVALLKEILTPKKIKHIEAVINLDEVSKETRDSVYYSITKYLSKYKKDTEQYKALTKGFLYAENVVYHLLDKEKSSHCEMIQKAFMGKPIKDIRSSYSKCDGEYRVLTDDEADEAVNDYLVEDTDLYKCYVENEINTGCASWIKNIEDWAEWVVSMDGRGSTLNHYDGMEEEQGEFFIYRTN